MNDLVEQLLHRVEALEFEGRVTVLVCCFVTL